MNIILVVLITVLVLYAGYLQWQIISLKRSYGNFFTGSEAQSLQKALKKYDNDVAEALSKLDELAEFGAKLHKRSLNAISHVGLVRFNPFNDTGGDQSFCLALLDNNLTGLIISSIHARNGTRFYAKQIVGGKPSHPLSDEEQEAYNLATAKQKIHA